MSGMASDYSETNSKIDWRFFQWVSKQALKQLTLGAVTTLSGRLFQSATTLSEKKKDPDQCHHDFADYSGWTDGAVVAWFQLTWQSGMLPFMLHIIRLSSLQCTT